MTDIEIARQTPPLEIKEIAKKINIDQYIEEYGSLKAKINQIPSNKETKHKLVLVTATSPTPFGEGKTTVSIALTDALNKLGENAGAVLREPSLGPVFGIKGGATGGGYAQVVPMEDINLHFTGDFHAITSANNLLASAIDNHIYQGNKLGIKTVRFKRCLDMNDRALRQVNLQTREDNFQITSASEVMTIFCLAEDLKDLETRLGNIIIGYSNNKEPIFAKELQVEGAMTVLLKTAFKPNLVQTLEHNPVIMHGGPFANISHGCNSVVATRMGLKLFDYTVTEAGFGSDLGAEKFMDIKCRKAGIKPDAVVLVTTMKSIEYNNGLDNLKAHIENLKKFGVNIVVALNKYEQDSEEEIKKVLEFCQNMNVEFSITTSYKDGGIGSIDLAKKVLRLTEQESNFRYIYETDDKIEEKIEKIAHEIYHAKNVCYTDESIKKLNQLPEYARKYSVCIAKTQYSLSDDAKKLGYPTNFEITVRDIDILNGSEMIVVYLNNIMSMPGLPKNPNYENICCNSNGEIEGIF